MPAGLPGATLAENQAGPTQGRAVVFDPLSGPVGSPFDAKVVDYDAAWGSNPAPVNDPNNISTGGLSNGIGFGSPPVIGAIAATTVPRPPFDDDYIPGVTKPDGTAATESILMYIGGGRMVVNPAPLDPDQGGRPFIPDPYDEDMVAICMAGNGGARDEGSAPAQGYPIKSVTATGAVANGAAVEAGFKNRSGVALVSGQTVFGVSDTANTAPA